MMSSIVVGWCGMSGSYICWSSFLWDVFVIVSRLVMCLFLLYESRSSFSSVSSSSASGLSSPTSDPKIEKYLVQAIKSRTDGMFEPLKRVLL